MGNSLWNMRSRCFLRSKTVIVLSFIVHKMRLFTLILSAVRAIPERQKIIRLKRKMIGLNFMA